MSNQGGVFVSSEQIYDEVLGMKEGLGRVEGLLEKHIALESQRNEGVEQRLENHGTRLGDQGTQIVNLDSRVAKTEADILAIQNAEKNRESKRAPWWNIVGAIVGIIAGTGGVIGLFITLSNLSQALTHLP